MTLRPVAFAIALLCPSLALAQPCPDGFAGCSRAAIAFEHRQGLPGEFELDTGWVPSGSPVQVRFRTAFVGHTALATRGQLQASWPEPMALEALGDPRGGTLESDYGVQFLSNVRLNLNTGPQTFQWEGNVPFVPQIDFRATARATFDPWGFEGVHLHSATARQMIARIPLTDAIVRIPGISGGLSFEASGEIDTDWQATQISFGLDADPITAMHRRTLGRFGAGPSVEYQPLLEGTLAHRVSLHVYPELYVSLAGRRWTLPLADIPLPFGPFVSAVRAGPSIARLDLPDLGADTDTLDFGTVPVGQRVERTLYVGNTGNLEGRVIAGEGDGPFTIDVTPRDLAPRSRIGVTVTFTPVTRGAEDRTVVLTTNDPDTPRIRVRVRGSATGEMVRPPVVTDAGVSDADAGDASVGVLMGAEDDGCGCRIAGANGRSGAPRGGWAIVALGCAVGLRTRRRRGRAEA